jgi:hypothetical protein
MIVTTGGHLSSTLGSASGPCFICQLSPVVTIMGHVDTSMPNNVVILHLDLLLTLMYLSDVPQNYKPGTMRHQYTL